MTRPFHISELRALHPNSEVVEFKSPPRFAVVVREEVREEAALKFAQECVERGIEVVVFCLGNAKADPNRYIFGNVLESM
ncbi:MAG: hypothetical protein ACRD8A_14620 [Candidatus Acidiferrales bacterium]